MQTRSIVTLVLLCLVVPELADAQLNRQTDKKACQEQIEKLLLAKRLVAKVRFPASSQGIDLSLDGMWNQRYTSGLIKDTGVGININDSATVTQVKLKDELLELQLDGGGFGTMRDLIVTSLSQQQQSARKASRGSRVNLRFNKPVNCRALTDAAQMSTFLEPLLNAQELKVAVARQSRAAERAESAAQKRVVVGMDKAAVFAVFGEPEQKQIEVLSDPLVEKWRYELPDLKTLVIMFKGGKVAQIDEF